MMIYYTSPSVLTSPIAMQLHLWYSTVISGQQYISVNTLLAIGKHVFYTKQTLNYEQPGNTNLQLLVYQTRCTKYIP